MINNQGQINPWRGLILIKNSWGLEGTCCDRNPKPMNAYFLPNLGLGLGDTVEPLYNGHHWFSKTVFAIEWFPLMKR